MATVYRISVSIQEEATGQEVLGAPLTARLTCDESAGALRYERPTGAGYVAVPTSMLDTVQLLVLRPTKPMTFRLDGQSDAGLLINGNGFVVAVDVTIDAAAATNILGNNASPDTAILTAFAAGT